MAQPRRTCAAVGLLVASTVGALGACGVASDPSTDTTSSTAGTAGTGTQTAQTQEITMSTQTSSTGRHGLSSITVRLAGTGKAKLTATDRQGSLNLEVSLPHEQAISIDLSKDITYRIDVLMLSGRLDSCTATTPDGRRELPVRRSAGGGCSVTYTP